MDPVRWERLQAVFHEVVDLPPDARAQVLDKICRGDHEFRTEVMELLAGDHPASSVIDRGLTDAASTIFEPDSLPGDQFGAFRIVELIKEGGMGVVYLAERADLGQRAAVKLLRDAWVS